MHFTANSEPRSLDVLGALEPSIFNKVCVSGVHYVFICAGFYTLLADYKPCKMSFKIVP